MHSKGQLLAVGGLVGVTILSGAALTASRVGAEPLSASTTATVTVASSCSMTGTVDTEHEATIINGVYRSDIGQTTLKSFCNDPSGYAIYAIGFSDDIYGNNVMVASTGSANNIATGTQESGETSGWAMKVAPVAGTYAPTVENDFGAYHTIPDAYTKVASFPSNTDSASTNVGSSLTTTYAAYISSFQPAGTYTGKVKYTLVHPSGGAAPVTSIDDLTYMQDFANLSSEEYADVLNSMTEGQAYTLEDNRDSYEYKIAKLADDRVWLLDNLQLDLTQPEVLSSLTPENTNADAAALVSLRSGNRDAGANYATGGFVAWADGAGGGTIDDYTKPAATAAYKSEVVAGAVGQGSGKRGLYYNYCAATAGTYCYDIATGPGENFENEYSVCPAGWRIPTGMASGEYGNLYNFYANPDNTIDGTAFANAISGLPGGYYFNGSIGMDTTNFLTSSTIRTNGIVSAAMLGFLNNDILININFSNLVTAGAPIRCIANQH